MVIVAEAFDTFWRDGHALRAEHAAEVGDREGVSLDPNVDLFKRLEANGALQLLTARCNGRLVGYLAAIAAPSLEDRSLISSSQTKFFVSGDFRGLGPRLERAMVDLLRRKGVHEVLLRAGVRGSGSKLPALYRRIGASECGQLFHLNLRTA